MRPGTHYEVELETTTGFKSMVNSEKEVLLLAQEALRLKADFFVACLGQGIDFGNFVMEINSFGMVDVRCHEHQGFIAHKLNSEQALETLKYWLPTQERTPKIEWEAE